MNEWRAIPNFVWGTLIDIRVRDGIYKWGRQQPCSEKDRLSGDVGYTHG